MSDKVEHNEYYLETNFLVHRGFGRTEDGWKGNLSTSSAEADSEGCPDKTMHNIKIFGLMRDRGPFKTILSLYRERNAKSFWDPFSTLGRNISSSHDVL